MYMLRYRRAASAITYSRRTLQRSYARFLSVDVFTGRRPVGLARENCTIFPALSKSVMSSSSSTQMVTSDPEVESGTSRTPLLSPVPLRPRQKWPCASSISGWPMEARLGRRRSAVPLRPRRTFPCARSRSYRSGPLRPRPSVAPLRSRGTLLAARAVSSGSTPLGPRPSVVPLRPRRTLLPARTQSCESIPLGLRPSVVPLRPRRPWLRAR